MLVHLNGGPLDGYSAELKPGTQELPVDLPTIGGDPEHWETVIYTPAGRYRPYKPGQVEWYWRRV